MGQNGLLFCLRSILGDASAAPQERLDPFYSPIIAAHSILRNAPLSREYAKGLRSTERFADMILDDNERRLESAEELVNIIRNFTRFEGPSQERGSCNSRYPEIDGRCNHPADGGMPMQAYGRIQQGLPHNLELNCRMRIKGFYGVRRSFKSERKCQRQKVLNFGNPT